MRTLRVEEEMRHLIEITAKKTSDSMEWHRVQAEEYAREKMIDERKSSFC